MRLERRQGPKARNILRELMDRPVDPLAYDRNMSEIAAWRGRPSATDKLRVQDWLDQFGKVRQAIDQP